MNLNCTLQWNGKNYLVRLQDGVSLTIPIAPGKHPRAWYAAPFSIEPVVMGDWVGEVSRGAPVNFRNVQLNPHGHGTHTESLAHITQTPLAANEAVPSPWLVACLCSVEPKHIEGDRIILPEQLQEKWQKAQALVIRTLPNPLDKQTQDYSGANPCYLHPDCGPWLVQHEVEHLLLDLPSVDREQDQGLLSVHHSFWGLPNHPRSHCSITEMIFVPDQLPDGLYLLHLPVLPWLNDAAPSMPCLFPLEPHSHGN